MELKQITEKSPEFEKVSQIYEESFPAEEKIAVAKLFSTYNGTEIRVYALTEQSETIGFAAVAFLPDDLLYLWYFAIDGSKRGHKYGTEALLLLQEQFPKLQISLCVELLDENAPNKEQRLRRIHFYERAGFVLTGEQATLYGGDFMIMSNSDSSKKPVANILQQRDL